MMKTIQEADLFLFQLINQKWNHPALDLLMPFFRNPFIWAPVYLFILLYLFLNFRKEFFRLFLYISFTFFITDLVSTQVFKAFIERPRPCWDGLTANDARMLIPCSTGFGFVSSHAANHFGISAFLFLTLLRMTGRKVWILFLWAGIVCYAQIYVGAHFPTDIIGGSVLGILTGLITFAIHRRNRPVLKPDISF